MRVHWTGPFSTPLALNDCSLRPAWIRRVSHPRPVPVPGTIAHFSLMGCGRFHGAETDYDRQVPAPPHLGAITTHVISNKDLRAVSSDTARFSQSLSALGSLVEKS